MKSFRKGQLVKILVPPPDENPKQVYLVLKTLERNGFEMTSIKPVNQEIKSSDELIELTENLDFVEIDPENLKGMLVIIEEANYSQSIGKVIDVREQTIIIDLSNGVQGVETNLWVTIEDESGKEITGSLI